MRKIAWIKFSVCMLIVAFVVFGVHTMNKPMLVESLVTNATKSIQAERISYFSQFKEADFTCTGITFDEKNEWYWIADYGALNSSEKTQPRLVAVDKQFSKVNCVLELSDIVTDDANVQGITYDKKEDIIWIAVGKEIVAIDKNRNKVSTIYLEKYSEDSANGVVYDVATDTLWVLLYRKYLLNVSKDGQVLTEFKINLENQDMLCISDDKLYATVGADYDGNNNFVISIDKNTGKVDVLYKLLDSYAIEGIYIAEGKMYVCNDGLYHDSQIKKSYIAEYRIY